MFWNRFLSLILVLGLSKSLIPVFFSLPSVLFFLFDCLASLLLVAEGKGQPADISASNRKVTKRTFSIYGYLGGRAGWWTGPIANLIVVFHVLAMSVLLICSYVIHKFGPLCCETGACISQGAPLAARLSGSPSISLFLFNLLSVCEHASLHLCV